MIMLMRPWTFTNRGADGWDDEKFNSRRRSLHNLIGCGGFKTRGIVDRDNPNEVAVGFSSARDPLG
ncbi:hypothetical protein [Pseudoclavibacter endophyticus]|uniref:Uncharacterized protein n=1 Tax=Pseudoclavibacter endophyticus TaxID=1778590 RepID=A0A6H9WNF3_9MICO|nr:hypothetical protein [Pseudoclavibacter endophyticus]KAB1648298.1 hypothetical protein F8O04_11400 [Pseudoclavibacter endophyticus]